MFLGALSYLCVHTCVSGGGGVLLYIFVNIHTQPTHKHTHNTNHPPLHTHTHLYLPWYTGGLHPTGHVDRVPPYVILGLLSSNHPRHQRPMVDTLGNEQQILSKKGLGPTSTVDYQGAVTETIVMCVR